MSTLPDEPTNDTLLGDADDVVDFTGVDGDEEMAEEAALTRSAKVTLREISEENLDDVLNLKVAAAQEQFVANNARSIAQAHFSKHAWFRAIYADETPVGFLMIYDDPAGPTYFLWRLMVDERYQKLGFGRQAMDALVKHVKMRPGADALGTSYVPGEGTPGEFYKRLGFVETGEVDEGEIVVTLNLWP